ncbi:hypothetical protein C1H57_12500 [Clostridium sp. 2-1]|uniref:DUF4355 domain-containing protein n=1 Tax=Clostridium TaxID=1485 RepID=UPI000CDA418E|nr:MULTISPECIES: DUF4355 domain-containing protein [Clostridium]MBN7576013.1 DUF4355 domain-containing protein [Clostridium beijerinckii]MBN7581154.1 DUF4355 domain-containing protein [Clostridium beijerinckii]MBN7585734.1 DUF4355 domain-containing protein [Clostridium beijerinckii]MBO0521523.1 DUF4355 domain-containing protein [Clostridium beijerinckii]POO91002.1 hypothetical protein C1H57_12500 [Clostridium sp. 2-1]
MIKSELLKKIEAAKDDEDINNLLKGTDIEEQFKGEEPTLDVFKGKIKSDKVFQQFMDSERDTYHSKALKTMKEKGTWESEFGDALKEKYPELVKDPVQIELAKERKAREELETKLARKDLLADAIKYANEKGIKIKSIDRYLGEDLDSTKANLDELAEDWSKGLESVVNERLKSSSYVPGGSNPDGSKISIGASIAQRNNKSTTAASDPWASK